MKRSSSFPRPERSEAGGWCRPFVLAVLLALPAAAEETGKTSLWRVAGRETTLYLGGTIHLLRDADHPIPLPFQKAYDRCDRLVLEVDFDSLRSADLRRRMLEASVLPDGTGLRDRISPQLYRDLQGYLKDRGMDGTLFDRMRPSLVAMTITGLEAARLGARPEFGVESIFARQAKIDGKTVRGLETAEFQLDLLTDLDPDAQESLLRSTLQETERSEASFDALVKAWKSGDLEGLENLLEEPLASESLFTPMILDERNRNWLPLIEAELERDSGDTLVLVGAAHLVGENGLLALLEEQGYRVKQTGPGAG